MTYSAARIFYKTIISTTLDKSLRIILEIPVVKLFLLYRTVWCVIFLVHHEQSERDPSLIKQSNVQELYKIIKILPNLFDKSYYPAHNIAR